VLQIDRLAKLFCPKSRYVCSKVFFGFPLLQNVLTESVCAFVGDESLFAFLKISATQSAPTELGGVATVPAGACPVGGVRAVWGDIGVGGVNGQKPGVFSFLELS
jgi:hypothetical protein